LLAEFFFYIGVLGQIYQHDVVLIEHALVAINQDLQVTFVL
jgi:hypothetical protein